MSARRLHRFPEAGEQTLGAAADGFGLRNHLLQPQTHDALLRRGCRRLREPVPRARDILSVVQQQRVRGVAVAAGTADLLVVRLGTVGHVEVHHETHVRTVDAHAESDRGDDDQRFAGAEPIGGFSFLVRIESGVERDRGEAFFHQLRGDPLSACATAAIDDTAGAFLPSKKR